MEILSDSPTVNSFVSLQQHQSATPASFYSGPPVLHYHAPRCKVLVLENEMVDGSPIQRLTQGGRRFGSQAENQANGFHVDDIGVDSSPVQIEVDGVDVWITSQKLLLSGLQSGVGVSIPYPSIALHAIQSSPVPSNAGQQALYMQLLQQFPAGQGSDGEEDDSTTDSISLTIVPQPNAAATETGPDADGQADDHILQSTAHKMFLALSDCSNLHPDSFDESADLQGSTLLQAGILTPGNQLGGLPPPMPGSSGWITAENMGEYFDEEGNWIGDDKQEVAVEEGQPVEPALPSNGPSTGTVRSRSECDGREHDRDEDGNQDAKWRRTD